MLDQPLRMRGERTEAQRAHLQMATRPGVGERHDADRHALPLAPGGGRRHDGKPDAVLHHAAHRLEARQAHAELKPPAEARGIVLDVLLQRAAGAEEFICPGCQP